MPHLDGYCDIPSERWHAPLLRVGVKPSKVLNAWRPISQPCPCPYITHLSLKNKTVTVNKMWINS